MGEGWAGGLPSCLSQVPARECSWLYMGKLINLREKNCAHVPAFPGLVYSRPHLVTLFLLRMSWVPCSAWRWGVQGRNDAASAWMSILYRKMQVNVLQCRRMRCNGQQPWVVLRAQLCGSLHGPAFLPLNDH